MGDVEVQGVVTRLDDVFLEGPRAMRYTVGPLHPGPRLRVLQQGEGLEGEVLVEGPHWHARERDVHVVGHEVPTVVLRVPTRPCPVCGGSWTAPKNEARHAPCENGGAGETSRCESEARRGSRLVLGQGSYGR